MRTGGTFNMTSSPPSLSPPSPVQRSPWHSPVPYLFGGLAAMLGLIAFALLILACSYWKLSGYLDGGDQNSGESNGDENRDVENGGAVDGVKPPQEYEEKILVIMAGQLKPTFLATPISSRSSSFGDNSSNCSTTTSSSSTQSERSEKEEREKLEGGATVTETEKQGNDGDGDGDDGGDQVRNGNM